MINHSGNIRGPRFKKELGQNFLRDKTIAFKIAESIPTGFLVLEIGPGDGFYTEALLQTGHQVLSVEVDPTWISKLNSRLKPYSNFRVITGNILKLDWLEIAQTASEIVITGNLPFHLATATLFSVFDMTRTQQGPKVKLMTVMMQKEVVKRITAQPNCKDYGSLTLLTQFHAKPEFLFDVPSSMFMPRPKVNGAVVRLDFKNPEECPEVEYETFKRIVRGCFAQRRKMMRNSMRVINNLPEGWENIQFDFQKRPENLSMEDYLFLIKALKELESKQNA